MDRSASTVSTNTLTTQPSDGDAETPNQSIDDISSEEQTISRTEVHEEEEERKEEDGSSVSRRVVTVRHFKRCKRSDNLLLTRVEMDEYMTVLPPGVTLPFGDDVMLETDVDNSEELLDDGVLLVHKVTRTKVTKAPPGEKDALRQETVHLPSENDSAVEDWSASSPFSGGHLLSNSGSSAPQQALGARIPAGKGVPVVEEELTEGKSGHTFRSAPRTSPSKWNERDRSAAEGERIR